MCILSYAFLIFTTLSAVKSYLPDRAHPTVRWIQHSDPKPRVLNVDQNRETFPKNYRGETRRKSHYTRNTDLTDNSSQEPETGRSHYNHYFSKNDRENEEPHFDSKSSDKRFDPMNFPPNQANGNNGRSYEANYPESQSQSENNGNMPKGNYRMQSENDGPENAEYSRQKESEKSGEYDRSLSDEHRRNIRYEFPEEGERVREPSGYDQSEERKEGPVRYPYNLEQYSKDNSQDEKTYLKANNENYPMHTSPSSLNLPVRSYRYYQHQLHQLGEVPYENDGETSLPNDSSQHAEHQRESTRANNDGNLSPSVNIGDRVYTNHQPDGHYEKPHDMDHISSHTQSEEKPSKDGRPTNAGKRPVNQRPQQISMRAVSAKEDMLLAQSSSDGNLDEEHDGFLDMGAYTDEKGSFGWYADFPVGKEHDKLTYSFS